MSQKVKFIRRRGVTWKDRVLNHTLAKEEGRAHLIEVSIDDEIELDASSGIEISGTEPQVLDFEGDRARIKIIGPCLFGPRGRYTHICLPFQEEPEQIKES